MKSKIPRWTNLNACIVTLMVAFLLLMPGDSSGQEPNCTQFTTVDSPVQLTFNSADDGEPSWSPDGTMIAFHSYRTGNQEIYIIDLATGTDASVTSNGNNNWHPDWSPDGQLISYTGGPNSDQIWVSTPDGSGETAITTSGPHRHPDWSPDGSEFAYTAIIGVEGPVRRMNSDGSGTPSTVVSSGWYADWSPDGSRIAFARYYGGGQIYLIDPDGSNLKNISTSSDYHAYAAWSPDGSTIACSITKSGNSEIYIIDTLGNELLQVTNWPSSSEGYPTWSPSGDAIAFHSNRSGNADIWKVGIECDGGSTISLDIKPGSCPNPLNVKAPKIDAWVQTDQNPVASKMQPDDPPKPKPVLPVAILGTVDFDVSDIDPTSVVLEGVPALRWNIEDVSTPVGEDAEECECNTLGADGYPDLTLKFDKGLIVEALGEVYDGDVVALTITGELSNGTAFEGTDCVVIRGNSQPADGFLPPEEPPTAVLLGNYPNPFNPTTEISFSLPNACDVKLEVYNVMGQQVVTIVDRFMEAGRHSVTFDGRAVASGVYFYRLEAGVFIETKKMVLLK